MLNIFDYIEDTNIFLSDCRKAPVRPAVNKWLIRIQA
jgi:hypothetical protein